jgi:hypothetical protein
VAVRKSQGARKSASLAARRKSPQRNSPMDSPRFAVRTLRLDGEQAKAVKACLDKARRHGPGLRSRLIEALGEETIEVKLRDKELPRVNCSATLAIVLSGITWHEPLPRRLGVHQRKEESFDTPAASVWSR